MTDTDPQAADGRGWSATAVVEEVLRALGALDELSVTDHASVYDQVHGRLGALLVGGPDALGRAPR